MKLLHIGNGHSAMPLEGEFVDKIRAFGEFTIIPDGSELPDGERARMIRECDVLVLIWGSMPIPEEVADDPGNLKYVVNVTGELRRWVPLKLIESGIPVTNWGPASADNLAEGTVALMMAVMKNIRDYVKTIEAGGWRIPTSSTQGGLKGCDVGLYGLGAVGRRFVELVAPFGPKLRAFDPYVAGLPEGVERVRSLEALFDSSSIVVIFAGLSDETRGSVNAGLLKRLPDGGIVINPARGAIIDQDALFDELETGRLRAGLDVLVDDYLPPDHPARKWDNLLITSHSILNIEWGSIESLEYTMRRIFLENLGRFSRGEPLEHLMTRDRYLRST